MAFRMGRAVLELSIEGGTFVRGAADAKAVYRDMARGIAQANRDISKQAFQFSGRQQIAEAAKMAEAVQRIGGPTRLVAADQARVNATIKQAIEHYKVLGKEAPKAWLDIEKATRKAEAAGAGAGKGFLGSLGAITSFTGGIGMAARALVGFVSVGAITGAIQKTLAYAASLEKAAVAAGGTTTQVQRLENIAVRGNTTLDSLIRGLTTAQDRIAEGGDNNAAVKAFEELRISTEAWLSLGPDEQIIAIANALQKVASNERQIKLAKDILGPSAVEVMGALRSEVEKTADAITKLSDADVKRMADIEARLQALALGAGRSIASFLLEGLAGNLFLPRGDSPNVGPVQPARQVSPGAADRVTVPPNYSRQLSDAQAALKGLNRETLNQLESAKKLGKGDADLAAILGRVGIEGDRAKNVIKLLSGELKGNKKEVNEAKREWQQMLEQFNGTNQRLDAQKLAAAIATGQLDLKRMTVEAQQAISKALDEGAEAWKRWGGVVPSEINRARAAVATLPAMVDELRALETPPPFAPVPGGDVAIAQGQHDLDMTRAGAGVEGMKTREAAARDHAKVLRDIDLSRGEAVIRQAEREGAKKVQILVMESTLAQRKRDAEILDAQASLAADEDALNERRRRGELETVQFEAELARREQQHQDHVDQINEQWAIGEAERRDMIRRESSFWASELGKRIAGELRGAAHEATGKLFTTFFAGVDEQAKKQAKEAREDYERIASSGKASAEEITRAYRAMRQAEEAANIGWANRFKSIWDGIKRHLFNIFDQILEAFVNQLIKGMLRSLAASAIGQRVMGWLGKLIPGLSPAGAAGGVFGTGGDIAKSAVGHLLGFGGGIATTAFSTTAGGTLAASMIAPSIASAAVPTAITSAGVSAGVAAGAGTAAGTAAAAGGTGAAAAGGTTGAAVGSGGAAGGGSALGFMSNPAFWTNPWTIAGIGAFALGMAVWKKGLFRGGEEALVVNPDRDDYVADLREKHGQKYRGESNFDALRHIMADKGLSGDQAQLLIGNLQKADSKKEFGRATEMIDAALAGNTDVLERIEDILKERQSDDRAAWQRITTRSESPSTPATPARSWLNPRTYHTGGVIDDNASESNVAHTNRFGDLKPNEVIIKALKGESVLTPEATTAIGGKPIIDLLNAGNGKAIIDAIRSREIKVSDVLKATGAMRRGGGALGGFAAAPARMASTLSVRVMPAIERALAIPAIAQQAASAMAAPAVQAAGTGESESGRPIVVNNYFQPKGVLDAHSVRELHEKHIVPMTEESIRTGRLGSAVRKRALE